MTQQYLQEDINDPRNPSSLEIQSYDFRQVQALVPAGTTATIQGLRVPGPVRLARLAWCGVLDPGVGETVALRLYRIRPITNPAGFGFIQLASTFTITQANFPGAGVELDFSGNIFADLCVLPNEYLACSWVHAGPQVMQPLNMNWNFTPLGAGELEEPPATTTNYADVFG
jgi:hypothetical protein